MSKIIVIPNNKNDIEQISSSNFALIGIEGYSVNTFNIKLDEIEKICQNNNNIFLSLNKNILNSELVDLEKILLKISSLNIEGLFYYDVAVVSIVRRLNLKINLIWSAEHLTTNYFTINYWSNYGVDSVFISNEITKNEILEISNNTKSKLIVQLFGYIPMYVSKRHAIKNYLNYFDLNLNSTKYSLYKEEKKYSIFDNQDGTVIYSNFILNGLREYLQLKDKVEYILINGYEINDKKLFDVINMFKDVQESNIDIYEEKLNKMFSNLEKGFLYEECIYKVKKDDKKA